MAQDKVIIHVDGSSLGNPGPAGIGVVLRDQDDVCVAALGEFIGNATNNVAEYRALLRGLEEAARLGFAQVEVRTDSELLARQISGAYRVKKDHLRPLHADAVRELSSFESAAVRSVPRDENKSADQLAHRAARSKRDVDGLADP